MNDNRFKFRVWDNLINEYRKEGTIQLSGNGQPFIIDGNMQPQNIDNVIIEQCTGLKDKNGRLIYEGDIITTAFEYETPTEYDTYAIKWRKAYAGELFCSVDARGEPADFYGGIPLVEYCRVIGNIHEMESEK